MKVSVTCIQNLVTDDFDNNLFRARAKIDAVSPFSDIVVLPEMFICPYQNENFIAFTKVANQQDILQKLSESAKRNHVFLFAGSIPEKENDKIYNTCFVFDHHGNIIAKHRKIHLFDVDFKSMHFKESDVLSAGNEMTVVDTPYGRIGVAICFDLRFPEIFRLMVDAGAKAFVIPASFNTTTGPLHWELLIRSRAIDNLCFTIACGTAFSPNSSYPSYGHSMIVSPQGVVLQEANSLEQVITETIDLNDVLTARSELPVLQGRRLDLYHIQKGDHCEQSN